MKSSHSPRRAFTLLELLCVVAVMGLLIGVAIPAFVQINQAGALTNSSAQVMDHLALARQQALTRNCTVEVRFYELPNPNFPNDSSHNIYRAMQSFLITETSTTAIEQPCYLSTGVQMASSASLSSLLDASRLNVDVLQGTGASAGVSLPGVGTTYKYRAFRFKADGSTSLTSPFWMTFYLVNSAVSDSILPPNWVSLQIDTVTGRVQVFRP